MRFWPGLWSQAKAWLRKDLHLRSLYLCLLTGLGLGELWIPGAQVFFKFCSGFSLSLLISDHSCWTNSTIFIGVNKKDRNRKDKKNRIQSFIEFHVENEIPLLLGVLLVRSESLEPTQAQWEGVIQIMNIRRPEAFPWLPTAMCYMAIFRVRPCNLIQPFVTSERKP